MGFCGFLGIVRYCAGLTELCGPAPVHPVRSPVDVFLCFLSYGSTFFRSCSTHEFSHNIFDFVIFESQDSAVFISQGPSSNILSLEVS